MIALNNGVINISNIDVPLYNSKYSTSSNDPLERILRKLKKGFIANYGLVITHLINRRCADEIKIKFLISNFDGSLTAEDVEKYRQEYAALAYQILSLYIEFLEKNEEFKISEAEKAEKMAINKAKQLLVSGKCYQIALKEAEKAKKGVPYEAHATPIFALIADGFDHHNADYFKKVAALIGNM